LFSSRRRHTRSKRDWSSDVCSSDLGRLTVFARGRANPKRPLTHLELFTYSAWYLKEGKAFYFIQEVDDLFAFRLSGKEIWTAYRSEERRVGKECRCRW